MENHLDQPIAEFRAQLYQVADMVADLYSEIEQQTVFSNPNPKKVRTIFEEPMPQEAKPIEKLMEVIKEAIIPNSTKHYSPHFYPWVTSSASQASILGDFIATALNINSTTWMNSAAASEIEQQVIKWMGQFSGYNENAAGVILSGGSTANLTGLTIARRLKSKNNIGVNGLQNQAQYTVYASEQCHFCMDKSVDMLGIGKKYLRKIRTHSNYTIDLGSLENQIKQDISAGYLPMCIIGNAGTVNTGAIDPLEELAQLCKVYNLWFHIDAAYGGCAANLPTVKEKFKGFKKANSVAIDLHKWLFVPFEAACILVKNKNHLKDTFSVIPEYQKFDYEETDRVDFSEYSFQQSRNFKALKAWMNFKAYGKENLMKAVQNSLIVMNHLSKLIEQSSDFELISNELSIVCFRYIGNYSPTETEKLNQLNKRIIKQTEGDKRVFIRETVLKNNMVVLRGCCTNFRRKKENVEYLLRVLREIGESIG